MVENAITASWAVAVSGSNTHEFGVEEVSVFFGLLAAGLVAGLLCVAWLRAPLRRTRDTPAERRGRFERRRAQLCLGFALVLYYAAALPVVIIHSGWAAVDPYLRGHLFDGFGCAALLTVAWSQLTRPMPSRLRAAEVRIAAAKFFLPLASAAIAAAAAYVANGSWAAVFTVFCVAYIFAYNFWNAVVGTAGYDEINKETSSQQDAHSLHNSGQRFALSPFPLADRVRPVLLNARRAIKFRRSVHCYRGCSPDPWPHELNFLLTVREGAPHFCALLTSLRTSGSAADRVKRFGHSRDRGYVASQVAAGDGD